MSIHPNGRASGRHVTPRELEVLALIADGYSTREIATKLWITDETVRTHVRRLLERLGARTRAHAVSIAYRERLWDDDRGVQP
jgi:DNA-binding CsgD family transcriptional regulator